MSRPGSSNEYYQMFKLIAEIDAYDAYLKCYKIRVGLDKATRAVLVRVQLRKAELIAELKMLTRNIANIPQSVRDIYY